MTERWISPNKLLVAVWTFSLLGAWCADKALLLKFFGFATPFTPTGLLWIGACLLAFWSGTWLASFHRPPLSLYQPRSMRQQRQYFTKAATLLAWLITLTVLFLLFLWTLKTIADVGGLSAFIKEVWRSWHWVRRFWPDQKPFLGARLLYTAFVAISIYASATLGLLSLKAHKRDALFVRSLLATSLLVLTVLPILASQRLLLGMALVGAHIAYTLTRKRWPPFRTLLVGVLLFGLVWIGVEVVRVGPSLQNVVESVKLAKERLLLYAANNVGNVTHAVAYVEARSWGMSTLLSLFALEELRKDFETTYLQDFYAATREYKGGGTWTGFGTPYVDFGWAGLLIIALWGFVSQIVFLRAKHNFFFAQLYGLIGASIVFSPQTQLWSSATFWFNCLILLLLNSKVMFKELPQSGEFSDVEKLGARL